MKPRHWFVLGSAVASCAAAIGIYLFTKGSSPADRLHQAASPRLQPSSATKRQHFITPAARSRTARVSGTTAPESRNVSAEPAPEFRIHGKPPAGRVSDERAWYASAERIGRQANHELEKLRETLELSPNQQQRIFDILSRNSPSWQPGMLTGGSHGVGVGSDGAKAFKPANQTRRESAVQAGGNSHHGDVTPTVANNEEVLAVLDTDQQQALIEDEINRRAWWEEILPQLLPPELSAAADQTAAGLPGDGDTKAYQGPTGIIEE